MGGSQSVYKTAPTSGSAYSDDYGSFKIDQTAKPTQTVQPTQGTPKESWFSGLFSSKKTTKPQLGGKRKKSNKPKKTTRTTKSNKSK